MKQVKSFFKTRYEIERERKKQIILEMIASEALKGNAYIPSCFAIYCNRFLKFGSWASVERYLNAYARKGWIKYNFDFETYGLHKPDRSRGYLCVRGMRFKTNKTCYNPQTGQMEQIILPFYPTHFKDSQTGLLREVENRHLWEEE